MTPLQAVEAVAMVQGWLSTLSWIGLVGGVALLIYLYYLALERLGDVAEHALEPKVKRPADLGRVPLTLQRRSMLLHETQRQAGERGEP